MRCAAMEDGNTAGANYASLLGIVSQADCSSGEWAREQPLRVGVVKFRQGLVVVEMNPGKAPPQVSYLFLILFLYQYRFIT